VYDGLGISKLISRVIDGYHGTIFSYGQTGSGKTYTMEGGGADQGITQKGVKELFTKIEGLKSQ